MPFNILGEFYWKRLLNHNTILLENFDEKRLRKKFPRKYSVRNIKKDQCFFEILSKQYRALWLMDDKKLVC